ncbi:MAG: MmgE/PrpD family protein [Gammaproteobacteria bacterium]|nr:MmgE/PrpD family protein [Gammaproteobacteria bacterium]
MNTSQHGALALAEELLGFGPKMLAQADHAQLERLLLDWCAVVIRGTQTPWGEKLHSWARDNAGAGGAWLAGSGTRRAAAAAALVNGTCAHGYELDDTHDDSMSHPGAVVISAAMAVAGQIDAEGGRVLPAIVAGYEAMARIGMAANALESIQFGFHPTSVFGGFGAAAAAAHLKGLSPEQLAMAWGHCLSMCAGSLQFSEEPKGTMVKRLHAGFPAHNGVLAAELAELGVTAPVQALEGRYGLFTLYGREPRPELLRRSPEAPLQIHRVSIKPYSCCRKFHSLIDALHEATGGGTLEPDAIESITVFSPAAAIDQHQQRRPDSVMAAQYSMPYIVGATLGYGATRYDAYEVDHHRDARILSIIDKVQAERDPSFESDFPAHMGNAVSIRLKDGTLKSARVQDSRGTPFRPLAMDEVRSKAAGLLAESRGSRDLDRIEAAIQALARSPGVDELMQALQGDCV